MSETTAKKGTAWGLEYNTASIIRNNVNKATGLSLRCFQECSAPSKANIGTNIPFPSQIIWQWNSVTGAAGYRWGKINNYDSAIDVGSNTSYTETGLTCNTSYERYVWVYSNCCHSGSTTLNQTTSIDPPEAPKAGKNIPTMTQITWKWKPVKGATGYLWNTTNNDTTAIDLGSDTSKVDTGLTPSTMYSRYVWAYNGNCGQSFPKMLTQTTSTFECTSTFTDLRDYSVYTTELVGTQCWMTQNLNIGIPIPSSWDQESQSVISKYCYSDVDSYCDTYGGYYQWGELVNHKNEASNSTLGNPEPPDTTRGICPYGWYIPDNNAWCTLLTNLDNSVDCNVDGFTGTSIGYVMKVPGTTYWLEDDGNNVSYFTARGGGLFWPPDYWEELLQLESYWSLTQYDDYDAANMTLVYNSDQIDINPSGPKNQAIQVRCWMDCTTPSAPLPGNNIPHSTWIIWEWNTVTGAIGYKWNNFNDYGSATNVGPNTNYSQMSLDCNTSYTSYVWAYTNCTHSLVTSLQESTLACPPLCGAPFTDPRDSQVYNTIQIGDQCWMQSNLNYGTMINGSLDQLVPGEKYCYNNDNNNCTTYGGLYQWGEAVNFLSGASNTTSWSPVPVDFVYGVCPPGWHVPSIDEFETLTSALPGGWSNAGYEIKESGTIHWADPNYANDGSNFMAFGTGYSDELYQFEYFNYGTYFWTSSENSSTTALDPDTWNLWYMLEVNTSNNKVFGFSVRCIRDY